jgi:ligand-binding sensor domain-containing protein
MFQRLFFLLFFTSISGFAQDYIYQHFGVDEGLLSSELYDMYQDQQGYIWFANDNGLSRYNGYEFENYDVNDGLTGSVVLKFYPQSNGQIWCYTLHNQALFYFDEVFDFFKAYKYNDVLREELGDGIIKSVFLAENGNLHLGGYRINGELIVKKDGTIERVNASPNYDLKNVQSILKKKSDDLDQLFLYTSMQPKDSFFTNYSGSHIMACWLRDNEKAVLFDGESLRIKEIGKEDLVMKNHFEPIRIKRIDDAHFFVGYKLGGGVIMNDRGEVVTRFLKNKSVSDFLVDHQGGYWFTTLNSGVYYIKSPRIKHLSVPEIENPNIRMLASDDLSLYVAYEDGTIGKVSANKAFELLKSSQKIPPAYVAYDKEHQKLLYYNQGVLLNASNEKPLLEVYILNISEPNNASILVPGSNAFYQLDYNGNLQKFASENRVLDVAFWKEKYYTATPKGVFEYQKDTVVSLSSQSKFLSFRAEDIDVTPSQDRLFIASQGAGVVVYGSEVFSITVKDGLYSNLINEVYVENDSVVWVCTNKGLNQLTFHGDQVVVKGMDKKRGLLSNEIKDVEVIGDMVWVGTNEGLCYFPKSLLQEKSSHQSFLEIKEISSNGSLLEKSEEIELEYRNNAIDFLVQEISYTNKDDITYQYRLKGVHDLWKTTNNRHIRFSPLPHGRYIFEVKSCINGNCLEKIERQEFVIEPPFWNTWWFYSLCIFLVGGIIYVFFKIRVLTYNKDLTREFIRLLVKRLKRKEKVFVFRELGNDVKINSHDILYVNSANNYINITTASKTYTVRMGIGKFLESVPDKLEYVRIHRSYVIRLDKVTAKSKNEVFINDERIPVGQRYHQNLKKIHF